jgi:drug/metabolite transporter (DMT)-like permease
VGTALSLLGVLLVIGRGSLQVLLAVQLVPGDLYILVAVLGWAFYGWLLVRPPAHMQAPQRPAWDWSALLFVQVLFGLPTAGAFSAVEQWMGAAPIPWSPAVFAALAYVALCPSIIAYRCYGLGVAQGGPTLAALFANLTPLITAVLSAAVLGESPKAYHVMAFALIASGIVVTSRAR